MEKKLTSDLLEILVNCFLLPHLWHMEVSGLGVKLELQLLACATATAMPDLSHICDLHHSSQQRQILNPMSEARDRTRNLMVTSQVHFPCATTGTPGKIFFKKNDLGVPIMAQWKRIRLGTMRLQF